MSESRCLHIRTSYYADQDTTICDDCGETLSAPPIVLDLFPDQQPVAPDHEPVAKAFDPPVTDDRLPVALVFQSKSDGYPHIVGVVDDQRGLHLTCTCKAYLAIATRPDGCWAMKRARGILLTDDPYKPRS